MKLTAQQIAQYDRDGYLHFPEFFTISQFRLVQKSFPGKRYLFFYKNEFALHVRHGILKQGNGLRELAKCV